MATVNDINTSQAVGKFLQRQSVTPKADNQANTADETQAVLETIAMAFLLYPQAALTIILNAKNSLQQIVQADLSVVEFMLSALNDVDNRDIPIDDTSDLVEAQTALVELDRLGRVGSELRAFSQYRNAIDRFLEDQLGPTIKRNGTGTFERTGDEARQDLFSILPQFIAAHGVMNSLLGALHGSVDDFRSVNLTNLVSTLTITRVRSSLTRVKNRIDAGTISKTTAAIELLSGAASLSSISDTGDLFDPAIQTGVLPLGALVTIEPESVEATALSSAGPWTLGATPWQFAGTMDPLGPTPQIFDFEIPGPGASGRAYVSSEELTATFNIPANSQLYLYLEGAASPDFEIALTTGPAVTLATLISDIDTALGTTGDCIQNPGTLGFLIFGSGSVTKIVVRPVSSGSSGTFNTDPSAHTILGFTDNQESLPINQFTAESLAAAIRYQLPSGVVAVEEDKVRITSELADTELSSIFFNGLAANAVQMDFGFTGTVESQPSFVEIMVDGDIAAPADLGVYVGGVVTAAEDPVIAGSSLRTLNNETITGIDGTQISFSPSVSIPRRVTSVVITSPIVVAVQNMVRDLGLYVGTFDVDAAKVQRLLSPIISRPAKSQIGDANRVLTDVKTKLENLSGFLGNVTIPSDRTQFGSIAEKILSALEERGLDRAQELLLSGRFSQFFSLTSATASKSNRLLTAMETVAREDLPVSVLEVDIDDDQKPRGTNPDSDILSGAELEGSDTLTDNS